MPFFLLSLLLYSTAPAEDAAENDVFSALWSRAKEERLWDKPEWFTLGHYHRTLWLRIESRIDDPRFFLAEDGKTNRKSELKATLRAFTSPQPLPESDDERSISCRFPARRRWLLEALDIPEEFLTLPDCDTYHQIIGQLEITGAAVVYPAAYLNNPASMFGHMLIVLDRKDKDRMLSHAVNYGAEANTRFGPLHILKGIFGLYNGRFALMPYHRKVEEYNALNRRDIFEYPLDLSPDELDRMLRHIWELQDLQSRYFFFKENCAFNLLYFIEAARPDINLTRGFRASAIPITLLKELVETGITLEPIYRPSKSTQMEHLAHSLSSEELDRARSLAHGEAVPDEEPSARILALAVEWAQFQYTEGDISPETYRERVLPLLRARSARGRLDLPPPPAPPPPEAGHDPRRLFLYAGADHDGTGIAGLRFRPAYHAWLDRPVGYTPGAHITFFETDLRLSDDFERLSLHRFTFVNIRSLSPPSPWSSPNSWAVRFEIEEDPFTPEHHRGLASFAAGPALELFPDTLAYLKLENTLLADQTLQHTLAWEPGLQWGLARARDRLRLGIRGSHRFGVWGSAAKRHHAEAEIRHALTPDLSIGLRLLHRHEQGENLQERLLTLSYTF